MKKGKKMSLPLAEIGGALAGAVATGIVKNIIEKNAPNLSPMVRGAVVTAGGAFLATQKSPLLKGAGLAMVSVGGYDLVKAFMPDTMGAIDDIFMSSPADQSVLSSPADQSLLSGADDYAINGDDFMGADDYAINGDDFMGESDGINGEDFMGADDYSINGEDN
jgi:hypothetical protein